MSGTLRSRGRNVSFMFLVHGSLFLVFNEERRTKNHELTGFLPNTKLCMEA